ncbi:hypothetical protein N1Z79_004580 [Klebsiella quasipneumoniae]|nr:hypothetical protein [Klebsiella quasipneumoniae]HCH9877113.1 hypothetical protein [Klebsiella pneumoniae]
MTMFLMFSAPCAAVITKPTLRKVTNAKRKRNSMTKLNVISAVSKAQTQAALTTAARITPMTDITELALLVSKAKASVFTLEYISKFEPADIDSDDVDLRFEVDGRDTGTNVSIVDECGQAAKVIGTLVEALEKAQQRIMELADEVANLRKQILPESKTVIAKLKMYETDKDDRDHQLCRRCNDGIRGGCSSCAYNVR